MAATTGTLSGLVTRLRAWAGAGSAESLDDRALLREYLSRKDETAFAALVRRHGPMVLGVCRKLLRHAQDAEDAFQAVFLVLARKAGAIRRQESVSGWLYSVATRIARKLRIARERQQARRVPLGDVASATAGDDLTWREVRLLIFAELERLADKYRAPLLLCYVEGKTRDEAARQLGCSLDVFRGRLERGRELLRGRLARRGLTLSAAMAALTIAEAARAAATPTALFSTTVQAAMRTINVTATGGLVSAQVAALTEGVVQAMFFAKLKSAFLGFVLVAMLGAGAVCLRPWAHEAAAADAPAVAVPAQGDVPKQKGAGEMERLRKELARLRVELEKARAELALAEAELKLVKAQAENARLEALRQADAARAAEAEARRAAERAIAEAARAEAIRLLKIKQEQIPPQAPTATSPDQRRMVVGRDKSISVFDVQTGKELFRSLGHTDLVTSVAFAPDGKTIASGSKDKAVILWEAATGKQLRKFTGRNAIASVSFTPDGQALVISESDATRRRIDIQTGKEK